MDAASVVAVDEVADGVVAVAHVELVAAHVVAQAVAAEVGAVKLAVAVYVEEVVRVAAAAEAGVVAEPYLDASGKSAQDSVAHLAFQLAWVQVMVLVAQEKDVEIAVVEDVD